MSKRTHIAFGLLLSAFLLRADLQYFIPLVIISSMLPDLDLMLRGLPIVEHRKTFHNVWFLAAVCIGASYYMPEASPFVAAGVLSHLLMDSVTKQGVMWLYPLSRRKLRGPVRTGGALDNAVFLASLLAFAYLMAGKLHQLGLPTYP